VINSVIHHLGIGLRDPKSAEPFFDRLFVEFLGLQKEVTQEAVAGWKGRGTRFYVYPIVSGDRPGTLQHLAFAARSRAEVDQFVGLGSRAICSDHRRSQGVSGVWG